MKPEATVYGSRRAATTGGNTAFRIATRAAVTIAPPYEGIVTPGTIVAATSSAAAEIAQATTSDRMRMRGRCGRHSRFSP